VAEPSFPFADLALSRRLERAEALSNARFVESRARVVPESGACWIEVAGAHAMFDGPASPATQTFSLGMSQLPAGEELDRIEAFFTERGAPVYHEVSPLADDKLVPMLTGRGYKPFEFTSVLYRPIDLAGPKPRATSEPSHVTSKASRAAADAPSATGNVAQPTGIVAQPTGIVAQGFSPAVTVRLIEAGDVDVFARTSAAGWSHAGLGDFVLEMARVIAASEGVALFLAELDGEPIATAALIMTGGIAHLAGASTIPSARNRGAQLALLDQRLRHAAANGCDIALMGALPGSGSQRNAERHGFRIAYTRIKWVKEALR
jgi:hypothetical protein